VKQPKHVIHVVGARPSYVKVAPLVREMGRRPPRQIPPLWDGRAAERIATQLEEY
jgi:hypothetical protein